MLNLHYVCKHVGLQFVNVQSQQTHTVPNHAAQSRILIPYKPILGLLPSYGIIFGFEATVNENQLEIYAYIYI